MKAASPAKFIIYLILIILSLAALLLVNNAPPNFLDVNAVYQGF